MFRTSGMHRKPSRPFTARDNDQPSRPSIARADGPPRHRKQLRSGPPRKQKSARLATVAGTALVLGVGVAAATTAWPSHALQGTSSRVNANGRTGAGAQVGAVAEQASDLQLAQVVAEAGLKVPDPQKQPRTTAPKHIKRKPSRKPKPAPPVYLNPLRAITGLIPERVDMGADFGGTGPIYALGNAVITNATTSAGWPGGGWITYQLTNGPAAGLQVFVAEDVTPTVQVGQQVTASTVIANMYNGGAGIETGWAMPDGSSAESQLAAAGGISGGGPFPTAIGLNFDALLQVVGVPAAPNFAGTGYGVVPSNYPTNWIALLK